MEEGATIRRGRRDCKEWTERLSEAEGAIVRIKKEWPIEVDREGAVA